MTILWVAPYSKDYEATIYWKTSDDFPHIGSSDERKREPCHITRCAITLEQFTNPHMTFRDYVCWMLSQEIKHIGIHHTVAPDITSYQAEKIIYEGFEMSVLETQSVIIADAIIFYDPDN